MERVTIAPEFNSGLNEFHLEVGPITSIEWDAQVSSARRILTITGPNGYVRVVPEPSTLALVACAALGAYRRRR